MKIALQIKANLENVTNFRADGDDFRWYMTLKCLGCGEATTNFQYLSLDESQPLKGGRGSASLVIKCRMCGRQNSIDIIKDSYRAYNSDDEGRYKTFAVFDCRGVEPAGFSPRSGFAADACESSTCFDNLDLSDGDWVDYDEKANQPVRVSDVEHRFVKV